MSAELHGEHARRLVLSVVVPSRDDARMLETCLRLLAEQTRAADEVIVVDNDSTDDTAAVASAAGAVVVSEPRHGVWPASAAGFDRARGDVIARLDADSRPPADWLERVERCFASDEALDAVTGPGTFYDSSRLVSALGRRFYIGGYFWAIGVWLGHPPLFGSNFAMRRRVWEAVRGRVHRDLGDVHDDLDLSMHLPPTARVSYERSLLVGISGRPFASGRALGRRLRWAYRTLRLHWPDEAPWRRRARAAVSGRSRRR